MSISRVKRDKYDRPGVLFYLFLAFMAVFYLQFSIRFPFLGSIRAELILAILLLILLAGRVGDVIKDSDTKPLKWYLIFLISIGFSLLMSVSIERSADVYVDRVIKFFIIGVMLPSAVRTPRELKWFLYFYLIVFGRMTFEALHGWSTGGLIWESQGVYRLHGSTPIYQHPNSLAGTQLTMVALALALTQWANKWERVFLASLIGGGLMVVVLTGSRTAYVAIAFGLLAFVLRTKGMGRIILVVASSIVVLALLVPDQYIQRFETIFTQEDIEGSSLDTRKEIIQDSIMIIKEHPLGVGPGAFQGVRDQYFGRQQATHNLYLEVAADLGIHGLLIFLGLILSLWLSLGRAKYQIMRILDIGEKGDREFDLQRREIVGSISSKREQLRFLSAAIDGFRWFLAARLILGVFGHDLYEVYWAFILGATLCVSGILNRHFLSNNEGDGCRV